jgi:hypothetical protein
MITVSVGDMVKTGGDFVGIVTEINYPTITVAILDGTFAGTTAIYAADCVYNMDGVCVLHAQPEKVEIKSENLEVKPKKQWTRKEIEAMMAEDKAVNRAVLALHANLDALPEKTRSYVENWAKWVKSGNTLSGKHLFYARRTCIFNSKVLTAIANGTTL